MKRSFAVTLLLLLAAVAGIARAHAAVSDTADKVTLTETPLYGDRAAAEGLTVHIDTTCGRRLFWGTTLRLGVENDVETAFRFSQWQEAWGYRGEPGGLSLYLMLSGGSGWTPGVTPEELRERNTGDAAGIWDYDGSSLYPLWEAAVEQTAAGETKTVTLRLRDYYKYYPFVAELDLGKMAGDAWGRYDGAIRSFFRVPVPEEKLVEVTVTRDAAGLITNIDTSDLSGVSISGDSVVTEDAVWYVFDNSGAYDSARLDTSEIPGGFGIYRLPYARNESGAAYTDGSGLAMVYPLDEDETILRLALDDDGRLLLLTASDGTAYLSVIETGGVTLLQRLALAELTEDDGYSYCAVGDGFLYASFGDDFVVAEQTADGAYRIGLTAADGTALLPEELGYGGDVAYAWDGARFAILRKPYDPVWRGSGWGGSFALLLYEGDGLAYAGRFDSSLGVDVPEDGGLYVYSGDVFGYEGYMAAFSEKGN